MEGAAGPANGVDAMARVTSAELAEAARAWAEQTCQEQGVAVRIVDPLTVQRVAAVIRCARLDAPDRLEPARVKAV